MNMSPRIHEILRLLAEGRFLLRVLRTTVRWFGLRLATRVAMRSLSTFPRLHLKAVSELLGPTEFRRPFAGRRVAWHGVDLGLIWLIFDHEVYCRNPKMQIRDQQTIIDAGAHVGVFTIFAALQTPHGKVLAIEPNSRLYGILNENVRLNGLGNVIMVNAALSNVDGVATLYQGAEGSGSDSIAYATTTHGEEVSVISIHSMLERYSISRIDFLKLNIEGAEYQLFSGDVSWLRKVHRIAMDLHMWVPAPSRIVDVLRCAGFQIKVRKRRAGGEHLLLYAMRP